MCEPVSEGTACRAHSDWPGPKPWVISLCRVDDGCSSLSAPALLPGWARYRSSKPWLPGVGEAEKSSS